MCRHWNAPGADNGGRGGLTYPQFLKAIENIWVTEVDPKVLEHLTATKIKNSKIDRIVYTYELLGSTHRDGSGSSNGWKKTVTIGSTFAATRSYETMKAIEKTIHLSALGNSYTNEWSH